jgi:hypothetical protein
VNHSKEFRGIPSESQARAVGMICKKGASSVASIKLPSGYIRNSLSVTSRQLVRLFSEQLRFEVVPVLQGLQGWLAAQG